MRRYQLTINGTTYTVEIAESGNDRFAVRLNGRDFEVQMTAGGEVASIAPRAPESAPAMPKPALPTPTGAPDSDGLIRAPMPGTILNIMVTPGTAVKRGQPVMILEAMKMNNTIGAPRDGTISAILVESGQSVAHGEPLARIE